MKKYTVLLVVFALASFCAAWKESPQERELREAVARGDEKQVAALIASGAHRTVREAQYNPEAPALFLSQLIVDAAARGRLGLVKLLVKNGARVNTAYHPLMAAVEQDHPDVVLFLLQNGADPEQGTRHRTPLMEAAEKGRYAIVKLLIAGGANPRVETSRLSGNQTAADLAEISGFHDIAAFLRSKTATSKRSKP